MCFQVQKELKRALLDPFTRSRQLQKRHHFTRPLYLIQDATKEAAVYLTLLLDQGSLKWSRRLIYSPLLLDPLLDPFTRPRVTNSTRLVELSKRLRILLIPHSTRHLSIHIGEEKHLLDQLITRSIDTKAQTLQHPLYFIPKIEYSPKPPQVSCLLVNLGFQHFI